MKRKSWHAMLQTCMGRKCGHQDDEIRHDETKITKRAVLMSKFNDDKKKKKILQNKQRRQQDIVMKGIIAIQQATKLLMKQQQQN